MLRRFFILFLPLLLSGCNQYGYRFHPAVQSEPTTPVFADFRETPTSLDILIDTHGRRLEHAILVKSDGQKIEPRAIDYPPFYGELIGGYDTFPRSYTVDRAQGPTIAHFSKSDAGPGPWTLHLDILGIEASTILLPTAARK